MELPKNLVQMGKPDKTHKIFIEDYVISYIKKWIRKNDGKALGIAFFGRKEEEGNQKYYFLYGGADVPGLEKRGPYLSQSDKETIAETGKKHFPDYEFLAWCAVKEELPESVYVATQGKGIEVGGYACFYENNESMLNYMLQMEESGVFEKEKPETEAVSIKPSRGEWSTQEYRNALAEKAATEKMAENPPPEGAKKEEASEKKTPVRHMTALKTAAAAMFVSLCVLGVTTVNSPQKLAKLKNTAQSVMAELSKKQLPDKEEENAENAGLEPIEIISVQGPAVTEDVGEKPAGTASENTSAGTSETKPEVAAPGTKPESTPEGTVPGTTPESAPEGTAPDTTPQSPLSETKPEKPKDTLQETPPDSKPDEPAKPASSPVSYTVCKGDTLNAICLKRYGTIGKVAEICELNHISNPDSIEVGQTILLP